LTFGSANPSGCGNGGSGPGRPSGMPPECTENYCKGGGMFRRRRQYPRYSNTLTTAFDDLLASEQVVRTFFLRVGDCTVMLGGTVEGITDGE